MPLDAGACSQGGSGGSAETQLEINIYEFQLLQSNIQKKCQSTMLCLIDCGLNLYWRCTSC